MADELHPLAPITADVVAAFLSHNSIRGNDLPGLIQSTFDALSAVGERNVGDGLIEDEFKPAVTVRKSLSSPDRIISLIDGKPYLTLKRHLSGHGLTFKDYKTRYGLPDTYPSVAPAYSARRSALAKEIGLGRKAKTVPTKKPKQA